MKLDALPGNESLKRQLSAQERSRGLSHAYLITGPAGSGKATLATLLSAAMVCSGQGEKPCGVCPACKKALKGIHPDIITVAGEDGKDITVAQARAVRSDAYIRPNEAPRKVYIFRDAATLEPRTQNVLLKLLEEGPAYAAFLLLCENPGVVLETIRSRCEHLTLAPAGEVPAEAEDDPAAHEAARLPQLLAQGDELALAQWAVSLEKWDRDSFTRLCEKGTEALRDTLVARASGEEGEPSGKALLAAVTLLEKLRADARFNVGVGHLCGALAAGLSQAIQK